MELIGRAIHPQYSTLWGHCFERVDFQIDENLLELGRVAINHQRPGAQIRDDSDAAARRFGFQQSNASINDRPKVGRGAARRAASSKLKQQRDHANDLVDLRDNNLETLAYLRAFTVATQQ